MGLPSSNPAPAASARTDPTDIRFVHTLHAAGVAKELDLATLAHITTTVFEPKLPERRLDILERYYGEGRDLEAALRRTQCDRYLLHKASDTLNAHAVIETIASICPEIAPIRLQRIGNGTGPLVLRSKDCFGAIGEEDEENAPQDTVAVRSLIQAANSLLLNHDVEHRFIPLKPDEEREVYLATSQPGARRLWEAGLLDNMSIQVLYEFGAWTKSP